ncbi:elongation factor P--(R)-beta-lysine ligase [Buchnera aphidicola (Hormaphis cornu)]|nr:elongation factor P--(R)-beta-lysine ligase [Buchnera aphidicola (Hormaphis cornu)]
MKKNQWRSLVSRTNLIKRAKILTNIRTFFLEHDVLEVETPILSNFTVTDKHLSAFKTYYNSSITSKKIKLWLATSPEYHMKRLLASDIGSSIYQISHSFRNNERGRYHNPEFTILEWYSLNCDMHGMIKEVDVFLQKILMYEFSEKISYQKIFIRYLQIDPLSVTLSTLLKKFMELDSMHLINSKNNINELIEILFLIGIEPHIGKKNPIFIYNYPRDQAALATINHKDSRVSNRFEIFFKGIELGNGFEELSDSIEQKRRFQKDNDFRRKNNLSTHTIDCFFLEALSNGLPKCSGIAIGIDRLIMLALDAESINEVISFPIERC